MALIWPSSARFLEMPDEIVRERSAGSPASGYCWRTFLNRHEEEELLFSERDCRASLKEKRRKSCHSNRNLLARSLKKLYALPRPFFQKAVPLSRCAMMLPTLYQDEPFAALFPKEGKRALAPWRLALVTLMQFAEGLSDRQGAHAVRARLDWKYATSPRVRRSRL